MNIQTGDRVTLADISDEPRLSGASGVIQEINDARDYYVLKLDRAVPGFYSGTAWFRASDIKSSHRHDWHYGDLGYHWCNKSSEESCNESEIHDFPCDHPEEHGLNDEKHGPNDEEH